MTIHYFEKIKKRIAKLEWLIERESIDTEYIGNIIKEKVKTREISK